ncbi:aldo/keto reductase [Maribacter sp. BPC-D8]|uniref:aldo/keto reductase n=1 Tax=Maribacter sp. BPC-D8 TaxID=3053613 RepID=UPI002B4A5AD4|nr:aldo/keto reductase [Maribacter sp. BPC-D8]WRI28721.1 aldo/keto reductase [Maribacter sp. BPC-D8]
MKKVYSKLGLGTVQFGIDYGISNTKGKTDSVEIEKILDYAGKNRITYIDTASAYGNAEKVLGSFDLSSFRVISKFMPPNQGSVKDELETSLKNLGLEMVYAYLAHRPEELLKNPEQWLDLKELKEQSKVEKIGYSLNSLEELDTLLQKNMEPDLIQVPYNLFDRRFERHIVELKKNGCEIHVRSAFLQGLFFIEPKNLPVYFESVKNVISDLQNEFGENLSGALLNFALEKEFIDVVVVGVENVNQLSQNLKNISLKQPVKTRIPVVAEKILVPSLWPKK